MADIICDFCSGDPVVASYHADDFIVDAASKPGLTFISESVGSWAACADCERLIDANDWNGLVRRARDSFFNRHPETRDIIDPLDLQGTLVEMYGQLKNSTNFHKEKL